METLTLIDYFTSAIRDNGVVQVALISALLLMALDVVFGGWNAAAHGEFASRKMREGLQHKVVECALIIVGVIMDALVMSGVQLPEPLSGAIAIDGLVTLGICLGLVWLEFASLMEIWADMNPKLAKTKLFQILSSVNVISIEEDADED